MISWNSKANRCMNIDHQTYKLYFLYLCICRVFFYLLWILFFSATFWYILLQNSLVYLQLCRRLQNNQISGAIPAWLGSLNSLQELWVYVLTFLQTLNNYLDGSLTGIFIAFNICFMCALVFDLWTWNMFWVVHGQW